MSLWWGHHCEFYELGSASFCFMDASRMTVNQLLCKWVLMVASSMLWGLFYGYLSFNEEDGHAWPAGAHPT